MHFIGTGFRKTDKIDFNQLRDKAAEFDLLASKTFGKGSFHEGLLDFSELIEIDVFQLSAYNEDAKTLSSRQISDELMAYYRNGNSTTFLELLNAGKALFPEVFYIIFACDWNAGNPVRLEKIHLSELKSYFKKHNSWYPWLYNYSAKRYYPNLELPLILEITND